MKKKELLQIKKQYATPSMMKWAERDELKKRKEYYYGDGKGYRIGMYIRCCLHRDILRVTFFLPELMKDGGKLPAYRHEYYNLNAPSVSDEVYDRLLDELVGLQVKTNIYMANSPTTGAGYPPVSKLEKVNHPIPLLSLDKVKDPADLISFQKQLMLMLKLDGLTVKLTYENYELVEASTRGDGDVGEIITHNVCSIAGIPILVNHKERLVVTGEAFICPGDFEELKTTLVDSSGQPYKNARNLAAGSVRLLDPAECREHRVRFLAFNVLEGFDDIPVKSKKLGMLPALGFEVCKFLVTNRPLNQQQMESGIKQLQDYAKVNDIPIDGVVVTYNDVAYSKSCGRTGHHYKDGIAFKFADDLYETRLRSIEWTPSRFGICTPVAVLEPVIIDGCDITHASLHNVSFVEKLELSVGCRVLVSKRNMIIPQVEENLDRYGDGVPENNELAVKLLTQAYNMGHVEATYNLGICYHYGYGTAVDLAKAYDLYLESANGGYSKGMELVGRFYNRGIYVEQDRKQAEYWLRKAMESSDPDAVAEARKELKHNG